MVEASAHFLRILVLFQIEQSTGEFDIFGSESTGLLTEVQTFFHFLNFYQFESKISYWFGKIF